MSASTKRGRVVPAQESSEVPPVQDIRARRRDARREQSQEDILDAAERVFGEDGIHNGSVRRIAELSGFSPGAIYLFFEDKADLVLKTFDRRGQEWSDAVRVIAEGSASPIEKLHQVVDWVITFIADHPQFRGLLSQVSHGSIVAGYSLAVPTTEEGHFSSIMTAIAGMIEEGQVRGDVRTGDSGSLAHLFSVVLNEYALLDLMPGVEKLTESQFHGFVDGALRAERPMSGPDT